MPVVLIVFIVAGISTLLAMKKYIGVLIVFLLGQGLYGCLYTASNALLIYIIATMLYIPIALMLVMWCYSRLLYDHTISRQPQSI